MKIDGKQIAKKILNDLKNKVQGLNITPNLAIILVGNDPASIVYVGQKNLKAELIGAKTTIINLKSDIQTLELKKIIDGLNADQNIHGIIVQQPLPTQINLESIINAIDPKKDVDGFHPNSKFEMPIALAVLKILEEVHTRLILDQGSTLIKWLRDSKIVVIGNGETGGKPVITALEKLGIQLQIINSKTENPQNITKNADIIISAVGKSDVIKPEMVKKGVILISIGLHKGSDGKLHGDYEEEQIKDLASFYTPTPGGVGPVNVAMLLNNLIKTSYNFGR